MNIHQYTQHIINICEQLKAGTIRRKDADTHARLSDSLARHIANKLMHDYRNGVVSSIPFLEDAPKALKD